MIRLITAIVLAGFVQRSETFGEFYMNQFVVNREFREQRTKFPLPKSTNSNKVMIENRESLPDSLILAINRPVFVTQGKFEVVFWQTKYHNMENVFTKVGGLWYLTEIRVKPL